MLTSLLWYEFAQEFMRERLALAARQRLLRAAAPAPRRRARLAGLLRALADRLDESPAPVDQLAFELG